LVQWIIEMRLTRIRVKNYSSFKDTDWVEFSPGINLIVGQNNAGKSALLRAFDLVLDDNRHRNSIEYLPHLLVTPEVEYDLEVSGPEIGESFSQRRLQFWWPLQTSDPPSEINRFHKFMSGPSHIMEVARFPQQAFTSRRSPSHGQFEGAINGSLLVSIVNGQFVTNINANGNDTVVEAINHLWHAKLFSFKAQRYSIGSCQWTIDHVRLIPDATNLPAVRGGSAN